VKSAIHFWFGRSALTPRARSYARVVPNEGVEKLRDPAMQSQAAPFDIFSAVGRMQFELADMLRRAQGNAFGEFGLGPSESPYRLIRSGLFWRLREYNQTGTQRLIVVAAPIKRPYIWDLSPLVSSIRDCMRQGLHVYLIEWLPASKTTGNNGLAEYTKVISECVAGISGGSAETKPFLIGHSLGGTLAAIFAATSPQSIQGLLLLGAPLCFQPATSNFRDALVSLMPADFADSEPCSGSLLSYMSALASPETFVWSRLMDATLSLADNHALEIHARVERWSLDEVPLPGKLVHQLIDWLYRKNLFITGDLRIDRDVIGPRSMQVPMLAAVNTDDDVAPLASVKSFIDAMPTADVRIIEYPGEIGVCLQHLGILIGRRAHEQVWPQIFSWINSR
jgi:polyhydroxyalkanoate synthase subunit PhaC